jgi:tRNA modification GTPase
VLNGKLDLVQAEAIGDLIDARSRVMHAAALVQLDGGLSRRILGLRDSIIGLEALIAYDIDFPEEDEGPISEDRIAAEISGVLRALDALLATAPTGELIREGAVIVIAGPPNAGKSSLFNALLGASRAIVTDIPGTTRDAIEAVLDADPWPLRLVDTAGLRQTDDFIEQLGIEVSTRYLASADVIIACGDTGESVRTTTASVSTLSSAPVIPVRTKADLNGAFSTVTAVHAAEYIAVSAVTGQGISQVLDAVNAAISARYGQPPIDAPVLMRTRHQYALETARAELAAFETVWREGQLPATVAAVHLRAAAHALEDVIGAVSADDVLERVFATFCVGK